MHAHDAKQWPHHKPVSQTLLLSLRAVRPTRMGGSNSKAERIEKAEKTGVLALRELGLTGDTLPSKIFEIRGLRILDLSENKLLKLPAALGKLSGSLTSLTLDGNRLKALPDAAIVSLAKLETLSAGNNKLEALPDALGKLSKLKKLLAPHNALRALPSSIGGCAALAHLDVSHNAIGALPSGLGELSSLVTADLSHNQLGAFPDGLAFSGLKRLKELDLRHNAPLVVHGALPAELCLSTALQHLQLDPELLGTDGLLTSDAAGGSEAQAAYLARRKGRIDKELHAKERGGDIHFSQ